MKSCVKYFFRDSVLKNKNKNIQNVGLKLTNQQMAKFPDRFATLYWVFNLFKNYYPHTSMLLVYLRKISSFVLK